ncbi:MAG: hypothetical protein KF797_10695, partial [Flavobacteriales bacterium]|nr:hypothetical protein [Flavobacteriales bacterium]
IYYASEAKQYMGDVAVATLIAALVLRYRATGHGLHKLGAFAVVAIWFSSITPIVAVPAFISMFSHHLRNRGGKLSIRDPLILWCALWCITFLFYYTIAVHGHPATPHLLRFWIAAGGLPAEPMSPDALLRYLHDRGYMVFNRLLPFGTMNGYLLMVLVGLGAFNCLRSGRSMLLILFALPVGIHALLSILHLYPFDTRLILYLAPTFILLATLGVEQCLLHVRHTWNERAQRALAISAPLILGSLFLRGEFPMDRQELRACLDHVAAHASAGDRIYVDTGASAILGYYSRIHAYDTNAFVDLGDEPSTADQRLHDAVDMHGPIWFLFTDLRAVDTRAVISHWDSLGYQRDMEYHASGAHAYRYLIP